MNKITKKAKGLFAVLVLALILAVGGTIIGTNGSIDPPIGSANVQHVATIDPPIGKVVATIDPPIGSPAIVPQSSIDPPIG